MSQRIGEVVFQYHYQRPTEYGPLTAVVRKVENAGNPSRVTSQRGGVVNRDMSEGRDASKLKSSS